MTTGTRLAETTAGIDLLYRAATGSGSVLNAEGLIPVAVAEVNPRELRDWNEATDALDALLAEIAAGDGDPLRAGRRTRADGAPGGQQGRGRVVRILRIPPDRLGPW